MTLTRRHFIATGAAFLGATPLVAQTAPQAAQNPNAPAMVRLAVPLAPNEIHVDPNFFYLYWTQPNRTAVRYRVGIGKADLYENGEFFVGAKKEWPSWTPTPEMIERDPAAYKQYEDGMEGGPNNPLGARALYLFQPGRGDTFLRIHGTNAPRTIGGAVSNGCVRLINEEIMDLYERVPLRSRVVLH